MLKVTLKEQSKSILINIDNIYLQAFRHILFKN